MSSLIDSQAQFESNLKEAGLNATLIESLKRHGVKTLSQLAFAIGQPGQPIADANIEQLIQQAHGRAPHLTEIAILKRAALKLRPTSQPHYDRLLTKVMTLLGGFHLRRETHVWRQSVQF